MIEYDTRENPGGGNPFPAAHTRDERLALTLIPVLDLNPSHHRGYFTSSFSHDFVLKWTKNRIMQIPI